MILDDFGRFLLGNEVPLKTDEKMVYFSVRDRLIALEQNSGKYLWSLEFSNLNPEGNSKVKIK